MNAVIYLDVPDWQIGQDVTVYFPDTMVKRGKCELLQEHDDCENCAIAIEDRPQIVRCKNCKYWHDDGIITTCDKIIGNGFQPDWFCAEAERK